jgi:hypothetical protein
MDISFMALQSTENAAKKVFQISFMPSKMAGTQSAAEQLIKSLKEYEEEAKAKKAQGYRVVVLFDGHSGNKNPDSDLLKFLAEELASMENMLDVVDNLIVANPDGPTRLLWSFCSNLDAFKKIKDKVCILT